MTKTALANKEIASKEGVEKRKLAHDAYQQVQNRNLQRYKTEVESQTAIRAAKIGAIGRVGGSLVKSYYGGGKNDPAWYKSYIKDLDKFVNVPTYDRLGYPKFPFKYMNDNLGNGDVSVPGIMILSYLPTVGPQESNSTAYFRNAVNQTLARAKEKVLALNSRSSTNWEAADLGYNIFASASIMTLILELGRVIRVYQTYSSTNGYLAEALIRALGWTYSDIEANFAEYRKTYTILSRKFNSAIVAPASISLYKRRAFLATNVFADTTDASYIRQMYAYRSAASHILSTTGDHCECQPDGSFRASLAAFSTHLNLMFSRITDNPDFIEMYQDLRHAFGSDIVQLPESVDLETIMFNTDVLNREQIHNTQIAPLFIQSGITVKPTRPFPTVNGFDLCQDSSGYLYQGKTTGTAEDRFIVYDAAAYAELQTEVSNDVPEFNKRGSIYNMHSREVSGDDIIDITRNHFEGKFTFSSNIPNLKIYSCGTEVVIDAEIWYYIQQTGWDFQYYSSCFVCDNTFASTSRVIWMNALRSAFDWAPIQRSYIDMSGAGDFDIVTFADMHTSFTTSSEELGDIHNACVMGELYCDDSNFKGFVR